MITGACNFWCCLASHISRFKPHFHLYGLGCHTGWYSDWPWSGAWLSISHICRWRFHGSHQTDAICHCSVVLCTQWLIDDLWVKQTTDKEINCRTGDRVIGIEGESDSSCLQWGRWVNWYREAIMSEQLGAQRNRQCTGVLCTLLSVLFFLLWAAFCPGF